jgi:hypothetical protein
MKLSDDGRLRVRVSSDVLPFSLARADAENAADVIRLRRKSRQIFWTWRVINGSVNCACLFLLACLALEIAP